MVGNSISLLTKHIVKAFSEDAVAGSVEESRAVLCATLRVFTTHLARLDLGMMHLNLGFILLEYGAYDVALWHIKESLSLGVRRITRLCV